MGRLYEEYQRENNDEGLSGYIKEKQNEIISKWQNESKEKEVMEDEEM